MNTVCFRHDYSAETDCPHCAATVCENCGKEPSTENWGGENDSVSLARNPRLTQRWCKRCVLTAQIAYAKKLTPISELERQLAALRPDPPTEDVPYRVGENRVDVTDPHLRMMGRPDPPAPQKDHAFVGGYDIDPSRPNVCQICDKPHEVDPPALTLTYSRCFGDGERS